MSQSEQNQIDRLYRRTMMNVAPVQITTTDDSGPIHQAQIHVHGTPEVLDAVPMMQTYGLATHPLEKTDATALFIAGQRANPLIISTGHQEHRPRNQKAGEVMLYDDQGSYVKLARGKIVEIKAGEGVNITCKSATIKCEDKLTIEAPDIAIKGKIELDGDLHATGEITAPRGSVGGG